MTSRTTQARRCFRAVDAVSEESPQRRAMDEDPHHHVVPALGLGTAERPAHPRLAPRAPVDVRALARLRVCLPTRVLLGRPMPLVGSPAVDASAREATRLPQGCARQQDWLLPPSAHRGASLARVGSPGVPSPARMGWAAHGAAPLVAHGAAPMPHLQRLRTPSLDLDLRGLEVLQDAMMHRVQVRCRLLHALSTVVRLTGNTRALSRLPRAFRARSTLCCLTSGDGPASLYASQKVRPRPSRHPRHRERGCQGTDQAAPERSLGPQGAHTPPRQSVRSVPQ